MTDEEDKLAREILQANFPDIKFATFRPTDEECILIAQRRDDEFHLPTIKHVAGFLMLNLCTS